MSEPNSLDKSFDKFSSFFNRNKLAQEVSQQENFPAPKPVSSEIPNTPNTPNNWDEEGLFDLDRDQANQLGSLRSPQAPVVKETPAPEIIDEEREPELPSPEEDQLVSFFGDREPEPSLRPGENQRRDLVYVAQAYVNSFKEGNPLSLKLLSQMCGKKVSELKSAFSADQWLHFFKTFGVDPPTEEYVAHLTPRQLQTLQVITNPLEPRKLNVLLRERGVDPAEWRMWMRQPEFKDLYNKWMKDGMRDVQGEVARQITAKATQGDPRAIETYLKLNRVNLQAANSDLLVPFLLRKLQQFMSQDQLAVFTQELKALTSGTV